MIFPSDELQLRARSSRLVIAMTVAALASVSLVASPLQSAGRGSTNQRYKDERASVLIGRVSAISAGAIAGASISLRNTADGRQSTAVSNAKGIFSIKEVKSGEYRLEVSAPGFKTFLVEHLPLVAGDVANANAVLEPGR